MSRIRHFIGKGIFHSTDDGKVEKEGEEGVEPLDKKIAATREWIAKLSKVEKLTPSGGANPPD